MGFTMALALVIFVATYGLLLSFPKYRAYIALASAAIFIIVGILPVKDILGSLDFNVLMMIAGTMGIVGLFIESKMPALLADIIIEKVPNVKWCIVALAIFSGIISAFVDNVATVLMVAPVAIDVAKKLKISPVPIILSIAVASNLQGAATLVGDTTSILLGGELNMTFFDFFWYEGRPGLFFVVQAGAIAASIVLLILFRNERQRIAKGPRTEVNHLFPTYLLVGMIGLLIVASFLSFNNAFVDNHKNGLICMALLILGLLWKLLKTKNFKAVTEVVKSIDYFTILLLAGLFIVIASISKAGVIDAIADIISKIGSGNVFVIYTVIVWVSVLLSAFIDNIPYVLTMLPVIGTLSSNLDPSSATVLYFGLLVGSTLGGNLTPIGASANITGIGILRKEGYEVSFKQFTKIGVPFTLAAVISGYILVWIFWGM